MLSLKAPVILKGGVVCKANGDCIMHQAVVYERFKTMENNNRPGPKVVMGWLMRGSDYKDLK